MITKVIKNIVHYIKEDNKNEILCLGDAQFSKTYHIGDIDYSCLEKEEKQYVYERYYDLLNSIPENCKLQITVLYDTYKPEELEQELLIPCKNDTFTKYRNEKNDKIRKHIEQNVCPATKRIYITITVEAQNPETAISKFIKIDEWLTSHIRRIGIYDIMPMNKKEALMLLNNVRSSAGMECADITDTAHIFANIKEIAGKATTYKMKDIGHATISTLFDVLRKMNGIRILTIHCARLSNSEQIRYLKKLKEEYEFNIAISFFGSDNQKKWNKTKELLDKHNVISRSVRNPVDGLISSLPIGINRIKHGIVTGLSSMPNMIPFEHTQLFRQTGFYYGEDTRNHIPIKYDRKKMRTPNCAVVGQKRIENTSFCQQEIENIMLETDDDICIIDLKGEYISLSEKYNGMVISATDNSCCINPMDIHIFNSSYSDPIATQIDFISGLYEIIQGGILLSSIQRSILVQCIRETYAPYVRHIHNIQKQNPAITIDKEVMPTLKNLYENLYRRPESEASELAEMMEHFLAENPSLSNCISNKTNEMEHNRLVVLCSDFPGDKKVDQVITLIYLHRIWNYIIENFCLHRYTWFYVDLSGLIEIEKPSLSIEYLHQIIKRARMLYAVPTIIISNISALLASNQAMNLLCNCDTIVFSPQGCIDDERLLARIGFLEANKKYIKKYEPGHRLLFTDRFVIPISCICIL